VPATSTTELPVSPADDSHGENGRGFAVSRSPRARVARNRSRPAPAGLDAVDPAGHDDAASSMGFLATQARLDSQKKLGGGRDDPCAASRNWASIGRTTWRGIGGAEGCGSVWRTRRSFLWRECNTIESRSGGRTEKDAADAVMRSFAAAKPVGKRHEVVGARGEALGTRAEVGRRPRPADHAGGSCSTRGNLSFSWRLIPRAGRGTGVRSYYARLATFGEAELLEALLGNFFESSSPGWQEACAMATRERSTSGTRTRRGFMGAKRKWGLEGCLRAREATVSDCPVSEATSSIACVLDPRQRPGPSGGKFDFRRIWLASNSCRRTVDPQATGFDGAFWVPPGGCLSCIALCPCTRPLEDQAFSACPGAVVLVGGDLSGDEDLEHQKSLGVSDPAPELGTGPRLRSSGSIPIRGFTCTFHVFMPRA